MYLFLAVALAIASAALISWLQIGFYSAVGGAILVAICVVGILAIWYDGAAKLVRYAMDAFVRSSRNREKD
jgi:hypothetical protein